VNRVRADQPVSLRGGKDGNQHSKKKKTAGTDVWGGQGDELLKKGIEVPKKEKRITRSIGSGGGPLVDRKGKRTHVQKYGGKREHNINTDLHSFGRKYPKFRTALASFSCTVKTRRGSKNAEVTHNERTENQRVQNEHYVGLSFPLS